MGSPVIKSGTVIEGFVPASQALKRTGLEQGQELKSGAVMKGFVPASRSRPISTITGKQVPTGEESGEQAKLGVKDIIRGVGPVVGDIALTALAPQVSLPLKAGKLAKAGVFGGNALIRALASALGSGSGAAVSDIATGTEFDMERADREAAFGAGGELVTSAASGLGKGVLRKFKPLFEFLPKITVSGTLFKQSVNNDIKKTITKRAEDFLVDVAPESIKKQGLKNRNLNIMVSEAYNENSAIFDLYKGEVDRVAEISGGVVSLPETSKTITDLWNEAKKNAPKGASSLSIANRAFSQFGYLPGMKNEIGKLAGNESLKPAQLKFILAEVFQNKGWKKLGPSKQEARELLKESLMKDLDQSISSEAAGFKIAADEQVKALSKFNSLRRLYNKALFVANKNTGRKALQPATLHEEIYKNKKRILDDSNLREIWPQLKAEADNALAMVKRLEETGVESGTGSIISRGVGSTVGGVLFGPIGAVGAEGIGLTAAWALLADSEKNILKRMLRPVGKTIKPATKTGLRLGGRSVFSKDDNDPGI